MPPKKSASSAGPSSRSKSARKGVRSKSETIPSGVAGLDEITDGGLPGPRLYLVRGAAGTGKTTLALQFLLEGKRRGEPTLYVTLSQSAEELKQIAVSHGWDLDGIELVSLNTGETYADLAEQTIFQSADLRLDRTRDAIEATIQRIGPKRIVYDSLLEIRLLASDTEKFRREVLGFKNYLSEIKATALLLDTEHRTSDRSEDQLENIAHGIIRLEKLLPSYGVAQRRVEVKKMRGTLVRDGYHDISIRTGEGVTIYPRVVPAVDPKERSREDLITCNVELLDEMLGGGLEAGTVALVVGQSGTGKSTLASLYSLAALERGERVAMFLFEERRETFFRRSEGLGINLRDYHRDGKLLLRDFDPTEVSPGEFSQIVRDAVDKDKCRVVLIDSFTGYLTALPDSRQAVSQMHALLKYVARRGALSLLIVAQHGLLGVQASSDLDISFLGDSVILLRMYEWPGLVRRTVTIVKKRHGPHVLDVRELTITTDGVSVEPFNPPPPGESGPVA